MVAILASSTSTIVVDPVVVVSRVSSDPQVLDGVRNRREIRVRSGLDSRTEKTQEKNRRRIHLEEKPSTQATGVAIETGLKEKNLFHKSIPTYLMPQEQQPPHPPN
jgi:hypothetical protein